MKRADRRRRVLLMETGGWGGIHYYVHLLCRSLDGLDLDIALLTHAESYELASRPDAFERLPVFRREPYPRTLWRLWKVLRRWRPDVLHIQSWLSPRKDMALLWLCRLLGIRVVITVHNIVPHEVRSLEARLFMAYYRRAAALILHSGPNREQLLAMAPDLDADRVHVVPHGNYAAFADWALERGAARQRLGLPQAGTQVLFFGAIRPYKGLDLLLEAAGPVCRACEAVSFVVAGTVLKGEKGPYEDRVAAVNREGGRVLARFEYLSAEDAVAYVCAADLVVLPYRRIYQSGVLFWAFTFGRPVLATRVGSFVETVEEDRSGWLVPPDDAAALEAALKRLVADPPALQRAGDYARRVAYERYDWDDIAARTRDVYGNL